MKPYVTRDARAALRACRCRRIRSRRSYASLIPIHGSADLDHRAVAYFFLGTVVTILLGR
jgi:hypothetical protein